MADAAAPEIHLFVLWPRALSHAAEIYEDLRRQFELLDSVLVNWCDERFDENLSRLYGGSRPSRVDKLPTAGAASFHVLVVRDPAAVHAARWRSWGIGAANAKTYDAKARYRLWTGGRFSVHATLDEREASRDVFMLLGRRLDDYRDTAAVEWTDAPPRRSDADVTGADGWDSLPQLLTALEVCLRYVVLWREEQGGGPPVLTLLVDERERAEGVAAGRPAGSSPGAVGCTVAGEPVVLELREVGDGSLDREWQRAILRHPVRLADGSLAPPPEDAAYVRLHELVARLEPGGGAAAATRAALSEALPPGDYADAAFAAGVLAEFMVRTGYDFAAPPAAGAWRNPALYGPGPRLRRLVRRRTPWLERPALRLHGLLKRG